MRRKLIIDGNAVYEIDDDCARCREAQQEQIPVRKENARQEVCDSGAKEQRDLHCCRYR